MIVTYPPPPPPPPRSPTPPPPKSPTAPLPPPVQLNITTSFNILHLDSQVMVESRKKTRKRKAVDKYTPPIEPNKKITKEKEVRVQLPLDRPNIKYHLPGVPMMQFKATIQYSLEHEVPVATLKEMVNWIADENTENEVQENAIHPLSKTFFQELTEPSSWVECDTLNVIFEFMKEKFYRQPDMCMARFTILPIGITSHLNSRDGVYKHMKNKSTLEAAVAWVDETLPDYVMGKFDVKWLDVDFIYTTTNIDQHWMLVAFDLNRGRLFVFDSLPSMTSKKKLESFLESLTYTLPSLLHYCDLKCSKPDIETSQWKIA
ncbi:uncharacterized protein LOC120089158 [Benincasa hispida]|uniref:uncharacterized protein LOC120089158 n=1 Tax=Benincasa hispida TaxID=102211 RepID=UPI0019009A17|nr:uncharacterized protein LOC120089158 [Benincasa hispida]